MTASPSGQSYLPDSGAAMGITQPNNTPSSAPSRQRHDLFPDIHGQHVPAGDKLAQAEISAGSMQTGGRGLAPSAMLRIDL